MTLHDLSNLEQPPELRITASQNLAKAADQTIAGFTQSMMKKPEQFAPNRYPIYLEGGEGAVVRDVDGNEYIDFICGLAANTLGHNHPVVNRAIRENLSKGLIHSLPAPVEIQTAQTLIDVIPNVDMVRFFKTGADANSAAIRLARYVTGKEKIVTVGYNGWHDQYMFDTPGVPKVIQDYTHRMPLFTPADEQPILDLLAEEGKNIAAVLLSVPYNRMLTREFLVKLREACTEYQVIFVFDEIVSGFRLALGGAQEYFNVQADLVTLSKGIAAGMPLSAVAGQKELMRKIEDLQVSTTFGGEMLSLEVCHGVLNEYKHSNYIDHLSELGKQLKLLVNAISERLNTPLKVVGYHPIPMFLFAKNPLEHAKLAEPFLAEMAKRGVLLRRDVNFICAAHTHSQIEYTAKAVEAALEAMIAQGLFEQKEIAEATG